MSDGRGIPSDRECPRPLLAGRSKRNAVASAFGHVFHASLKLDVKVRFFEFAWVMRRLRPGYMVVGLALGFAALPSTGQAFWQRSHWAACSEAPTDAERIRLNCSLFVPAHDWPLAAYEHTPPGYRGPLFENRLGPPAKHRRAPLVVK